MKFMSASTSMTSVSYSEFINNIQDLLERGETDQATVLFKDENNKELIEENVWDLIKVIAHFVNSENEKSNHDVFCCCLDLLTIIGTESNPKEALLQFLSEIEDCQDDTKFANLLKPLQITLIRTPQTTWKWCFNDIWKYLKKCDPPDNHNLVGKEKLFLDSSEKVRRITTLYTEVLKFYGPFTNDLCTASYDLNSHPVVTRTFLIQLLGKPLVYLDMEVFNNVKSRARVLAESLVHRIFKTTNDLFPLLKYRYLKNNDNILQIDDAGLASLMYLVYSEQVLLDRVPVVYNPVNLFQHALFLVTVLLEHDLNIVIEKGLKLASALMERIKGYQLSYDMLESEDHYSFCKILSRVIVYNQIETIRKSAFEIYKTYLTAFDNRGFYLLIYNLMSTLNHTGLISFTITAYKDRLVSEFSKGENMSKYFKGSKLGQLLNKFCYLHKKEESDLIELHEQIMATLNLLRYLAIADKENTTGIWEYFDYLQDTYFKYLREGIDLSRAHFVMVIKDLEEKKTLKKEDTPINNMNITVAGQNLGRMPSDEKLIALKSCLTAYDMMESLLCRVQECVETNRSP